MKKIILMVALMSGCQSSNEGKKPTCTDNVPTEYTQSTKKDTNEADLGIFDIDTIGQGPGKNAAKLI